MPNNSQVMYERRVSVSENTSLIYIKKRMEDTGDHCGIWVSILCLRLINPSITSSTHLSDRKNFVYQIRLSLIPWSAIIWASFARET